LFVSLGVVEFILRVLRGFKRGFDALEPYYWVVLGF
jgi:hypothetical protein